MAKRKGTKALDAAIDLLQRLSAVGLSYTAMLVALEAVRQQRSGKKPRLQEISDVLGIPYTTVSRVAYDLIAQHGLAEYEDDATDRRIKYLVVPDEARVVQLVQELA